MTQQPPRLDSLAKHEQIQHEQIQSLVESLMNLSATDRYEVAMYLLHSIATRIDVHDGTRKADQNLIDERLAEYHSGVKMVTHDELMEAFAKQSNARK